MATTSECWILTYTGREIDLLNPDPALLVIEDIAHALSLICRFTGHVRRHYSVAQHSVFVSRICPPEIARWALLHDAAEAYVGDMSSPLKRAVGESYRRIEAGVAGAISEAFDAPIADVKPWDLAALMSERRDLMPQSSPWVCEAVKPHPEMVCPLNPGDAEELFLARYHRLWR